MNALKILPFAQGAICQVSAIAVQAGRDFTQCMPVVVYRRFETAYRLHPQGSALIRLDTGQVSRNDGKGPQHTLRNIPEVPRSPEGFCPTECGNNYSKLQLLRHRTSLLMCAGYRSRHNSHFIHYRHAKR